MGGPSITTDNNSGGGGSVDDTAYGVSWDGDTTTAASKNALYDKIEAIASGGEVNTASNLGGGLANFDSKSTSDLRFNSFDSSDFDLASNLISIDDVNWASQSEVDAKEDLLVNEAGLYAALSDVTEFVETSDTTGWDKDPDDDLLETEMDSFSEFISQVGITGTPNGSKFLRDDGTFQSIPGGGDALTSNPLSQFASTTSAQFAGVISNETGTGAVVLANSPVFTTPNIGSATGSISGNAGTATALAANGANCSAGSYPLGVDASGAVESCTDATTEINSAISTHASIANAHHNPVTVTDSSEIDFTLATQDVTASIVAGSIDETKLDASVNASLDLADSSLQSFTEADPTVDTSAEIQAIIGAGVYQPSATVLTNTTASFTTALETKLNGIEALADVTDTANVTAAGALMDSEVDADIKTMTIAPSSSISGTNTGDQTNISGNSATTNALNSATTVVNVSSATAPTSGQVLTATSSTAATWQTPSGGASSPLTLTASSTTEVPLTIEAATSQTANLTEWQDSSGTNINYILPGGGQIIKSNDSYRSLLLQKGGGSNNAGVTFYDSSLGKYATVGLNSGKLTLTNTAYVNNGNLIQFGTAGSGASVHSSDSNNLYGQGAINSELAPSATYPSYHALMRGAPTGTEEAIRVTAGSGYFTKTFDVDYSGLTTIAPISASTKGLIVKGAASQTANLTEWQNNSGTALANIDASGNISATNLSGTNTGDQDLSSYLTAASTAQTDTGTSTSLAVTPDGLAGSNFGEKAVTIYAVEGATDTAVADGVAYFNIPSSVAGMNLVEVHAHVVSAGTTGTTDIQIHNVTSAVDMLTTKLTVDSGETSSSTAAVAAVIDTANDDVASNELIRIDVDAVSSTPATGLIVTLVFRLP